MPIKIKNPEVTQPGTPVLTYVLVATGLSTRRADLTDRTTEDVVAPTDDTSSPSARDAIVEAFDERQPRARADGRLLVDVHLFWGSDGVDLEGSVPEGGAVVLHPSAQLTRLSFTDVSLEPTDSVEVAPSWRSASFELKPRAGEGDQLVSGLVCEAGADYADAIMSTTIYLTGSEESPSLWSRLWAWLFG